MKKLILILILTSGALLPFAQSALGEEEYYTWVDENGVTNYAERNPEGIDATFVTSSRAFGQRTLPRDSSRDSARDSGRPQASQNSTGRADTNGPDPDSLVDEQAAALAAEVASIKQKNCEIGKNNLAQIKAFARIRVTDEKGENRILTDEEKQARADQARQTIRDNCTG
jgi:hypothetical protein